MKITRNEKQFEPISIILESQMEIDALVDVLTDVLCSIHSNTGGSNEATEFISVLAKQLMGYASDQDKLVYYYEPHSTVKAEAKEILFKEKAPDTSQEVQGLYCLILIIFNLQFWPKAVSDIDRCSTCYCVCYSPVILILNNIQTPIYGVVVNILSSLCLGYSVLYIFKILP